ncbi:MAG: ArsC/Spx/MgsR family protein [Pseudomonadota bacterium]
MIYTVLHNPRCSKSRKTLEILQSHGIQPDIVRYLDTPPSADELLSIAKRLERPLAELLRRGEATFRDAEDLPDLDDAPTLANWISAHPDTLERPIVLRSDGAACLGRPPDNVLELIDHE